MDFPWLSLIVLSPLLAAGALLFVPSESRGTVRMLSVLSTVVSLIGAVVVALGYDREVGGPQFRASRSCRASACAGIWRWTAGA